MPPIKPHEIVKKIPEEVFDAFNHFIIQNFDGTQSIVKQEEIIAKLVKEGMKKDDIFKNRMLDIEDHYKKAGWQVEYEKPGFNETGEPYFKFTKKAKNK